MVRGAGLEPVKSPLTVFPASGANGVSLPFIARRVSENAFCFQVIYGNQWHLRAINLVQESCKILVCAKSVQTQCRPENCANYVQTFQTHCPLQSHTSLSARAERMRACLAA
jgi:hypothetical protein